jgi:hypothetical protein
MKKLTVKKLIEHLQTNFKPTDKLCFWYEGGAYMNCEHALEDMLGDMMFTYVKDDKKRMMERFKRTKAELDDDYRNVSDDDVIIH